MEFLTMTAKPTFRADFKPGDGGTKERERAPSSWLARLAAASLRSASPRRVFDTADLRHGGSGTRSTRERRGEKRPWSKIATATVAA